jgi:hypothetical protein
VCGTRRAVHPWQDAIAGVPGMRRRSHLHAAGRVPPVGHRAMLQRFAWTSSTVAHSATRAVVVSASSAALPTRRSQVGCKPTLDCRVASAPLPGAAGSGPVSLKAHTTDGQHDGLRHQRCAGRSASLAAPATCSDSLVTPPTRRASLASSSTAMVALDAHSAVRTPMVSAAPRQSPRPCGTSSCAA